MEDSKMDDGASVSRPFPSTYAMTDRESKLLTCVQVNVAKDPDQSFINEKFESMACFGYLTAVEWVLSEKCPIKPDQEAMNFALRGAAHRCSNAMVRWLLSQPDGKLKPDQQTINMVYERVSEDVCYKAPEDPMLSLMNEAIAILKPFTK